MNYSHPLQWMDGDATSPGLESSSACSSAAASPVLVPAGRDDASTPDTPDVPELALDLDTHLDPTNRRRRSRRKRPALPDRRDTFNELIVTEAGEERMLLHERTEDNSMLTVGAPRQRQHHLRVAQQPVPDAAKLFSPRTPSPSTSSQAPLPDSIAGFAPLFPPVLSYQFAENAIPLLPDFSRPMHSDEPASRAKITTGHP